MNAAQAEIEHLEATLAQAMLTGDAGRLEALIDERLLFVGPDGSLISKQADLALYRSGEQRITALDAQQRRIEGGDDPGDQVVTVSVVAALAGVFKGHAFAGRFRYLRVWRKTAAGWRIVAGSVVALPSS